MIVQSTTQVFDSSLLDSIRQRLRSQLIVEPLIWIAIDNEQWRLADDEHEVRTLASSETPLLESLNDNLYQYFLPLGMHQNQEIAATGKIKTDSPDLWLRLAESVCQNFKVELENQDLRLENEEFAQQAIDSLEELNFLKFATNEMGGANLSDGVSPFINKILVALRTSISAQTVELVWNCDHEIHRSLELESSYVTNNNGNCWPDADRLIERFYSPHNTTTMIRNNCQCESEFIQFDLLNNFAITPIHDGHSVLAWLVAVNRTFSEFTKSNWEAPSTIREFGTIEAMILEASAAIICSHVANVSALREQELLLTSTVKSLVSALDAKDPYTCGHSERVALYAQLIACKMGFDEQQIERIYMTGLLHDIGKIGVGEQTLNHPGALSEKQFDLIKMHPHSGWSILQGIKQLEYVLPGVLFHHERMDGAGYPDNLVSDEIPLEARILAVADAYDAMTSDRPYRKGMSHERAARILTEGCHTQWDSEIVEIFLSSEDQIQKIRSRHHQSAAFKRNRGSVICEK